MKQAQRKDFFREIRKSMNRFLSILFMVALGVAFYSGVRSTEPDMRITGDAFYDETKLMDLRVLGSLGVTGADLEAIAGIEGVESAEGAYSAELYCISEDKDYVCNVISATDTVNQMTVLEGRMPENAGECFVDRILVERGNFRIGDTIRLRSDQPEDIEDILHSQDTAEKNMREYKIVGYGNYSYYLSWERGSAAIGSGKTDAFVVLPKAAFSMEVYSGVYARVAGAEELNCYSDRYGDAAEEVTDRIEEIAGGRSELRLSEVQKEGYKQIADAEIEIADGENKLNDAETKLEDAKKELSDAKEELAEGEKKLEDGKIELSEGEQKLEDAKKEIKQKEKELNDGIAELSKQEDSLGKAEDEAAESGRKLSAAKKELDASEQQIQEGRSALKTGKKELEEKREYLTSIGADLSVLEEAETQLAAQEGLMDEAQGEWSKGFEIYTAGIDALSAGNAKLAAGRKELTAAKEKAADGERALAEGKQKIKDSEKKLEASKEEILKAEEELSKGRQKYEDGLQEYEEAKAEYDKESKTAGQDIADARQKVAEAKEDLEQLKTPEWYVLDRNTIQTYVELDNDAQRIGAIGTVFPAIFFLVAALVSLTTMTRMVEEGRIQIGTMKALGYPKISIAAKYLLYALAASLLGSILGIMIGSWILPGIIIKAYSILYVNLPPAVTPVNWMLSGLSLLIAVSCTVVATELACNKELSATPAQLMRPAAPKQGQRVLLERIPFIWKRLNFSKKSTVRNLLRYKKRLLMTIFGIGGCMALLMVGFGLRDSIKEIVNNQYRILWTYDAYLTVDEEMSAEDAERLKEDILTEQPAVKQALYARQYSIDIEANGVTKSVYLFTPQTMENLDDFLVLKNRTTDERYHISEEGVVLTEKAASLLKVGVGDEIVIKESDTILHTVPVTAVVENYLYHYVYLSPSYYEKVFGSMPLYNQLFLKLPELDARGRESLATELLKMDHADSWMYVRDLEETVQNMMGSLDSVIWVLIVAAGLLAFVVLYNLNNISIIERHRELATIKVLGFYDMEVAQYVYRENIVLTLMGIAAGVVMGLVLHQFVIRTSEVDIIMFGRNIKWLSYLLSILFTIIFAAVVNFTMYFKLRRIDMVESLKSVE